MALTWTLVLLSAHPGARQRLEEEAGAVPGDGPADPAQLPWTTAVVSEAMRLYPPAWTLERTAVGTDDVCGTTVPAGSMVAVLLLARICRHYRVDLTGPALPSPRGHLTLHPARPIPMRLTPRG